MHCHIKRRGVKCFEYDDGCQDGCHNLKISCIDTIRYTRTPVLFLQLGLLMLLTEMSFIKVLKSK